MTLKRCAFHRWGVLGILSLLLWAGCGDDIPDPTLSDLQNELDKQVRSEVDRMGIAGKLGELAFNASLGCVCETPTEDRRCQVTFYCDGDNCSFLWQSDPDLKYVNTLNVAPQSVTVDFQIQYTDGTVDENGKTKYGRYDAENGWIWDGNADKKTAWETYKPEKNSKKNPVYQTGYIKSSDFEKIYGEPLQKEYYKGYFSNASGIRMFFFRPINIRIPGELTLEDLSNANADYDPSNKVSFKIRPRYYINDSKDPIIGPVYTLGSKEKCVLGEVE